VDGPAHAQVGASTLTEASIVGRDGRLLYLPERLERLEDKIATHHEIVRLSHARDHDGGHGQGFEQVHAEDGRAAVDELGSLERTDHAKHDSGDDSVQNILKEFVSASRGEKNGT
jgi:hypothetical protein